MILRFTASVLTVFMMIVMMQNPSDLTNSKSGEYMEEFTGAVQKADCTQRLGIIEIGLERFSSGDYDQTLKARNDLLAIASESGGCKQAVVHALMHAMDQPNLDFERQSTNYYLWREGSQLLGELKAVEALDLLISHLNLTNGFHSGSMVFQPAILGVSQMGEAAVPKLALALKENPTSRIRIAAAYCLTEIGGVSAMDALRQTLSSETNSCVANFISISLHTFTYQSKNGISFNTEAPQVNSEARLRWLTAFDCVE